MSIQRHDSQIASSSSHDIDTADAWLQNHLRNLSPTDTKSSALLADYEQCKNTGHTQYSTGKVKLYFYLKSNVIQLKYQLEIRNGRRTGLIGLLVAICIPFTFISVSILNRCLEGQAHFWLVLVWNKY